MEKQRQTQREERERGRVSSQTLDSLEDLQTVFRCDWQVSGNTQTHTLAEGAGNECDLVDVCAHMVMMNFERLTD